MLGWATRDNLNRCTIAADCYATAMSNDVEQQSRPCGKLQGQAGRYLIGAFIALAIDATIVSSW